ncbi:MAG: hypothetical protein ACXAC5_25370 [Promethearchaeota archaeon]|jgi:hypothetical protein
MDKTVSFQWAASGTEALVKIELLQDAPDATIVKIFESDWPLDIEGAKRCLQQRRGWMHMLCCLKAYLEHGIDLRRGGVVKQGSKPSVRAGQPIRPLLNPNVSW